MGQRSTEKRMLQTLTTRKVICTLTLAGCCSLAYSRLSPATTFIGSHRLVTRQRNSGQVHHPHLEPPCSLQGLERKRRHGWVGLTPMSQSTSLQSETDTQSTMEGDDNSNMITAGEYYDEQQFAAFETAIEAIVSKRGVLRDFRKNEEDLTVVKNHLLDKKRKLPQWDVEQFLPSKVSTKSHPEESSNTTGEEEDAVPHTKQKLRLRCEMYLEHTGLTQPQHRLATVLLAHLADHCAKNSSPQPLYVAWEKILEAGLTPLSRTLSTYLYVLSLEDDTGTTERDIAAEVAMFHDALYEPTEKTITLLVKSLVGRGDAAGAEALLDGIADGPLGKLRHRTTSPILKSYCEKGEIDSALRLYNRMRTTSRVKLFASTYADFIAAVAENGYFKSDAECIVGAEDLGYSSQACGSELLHALITEMAEDVLDISEESARVLHNGFVKGFAGSLDVISDSDDMQPITTLFDDKALVANRVVVDKDSAICPATNTTLRLIVLEQSQRVHVHDTLIEMAREKSMEYTARLATKGRSTKDNVEKAERATQILKEFSEWMDAREGKPYTAIVDGANIAYFGWGKINVFQLIHMMDALEKQGEHPLVVFPEKYTRKKFHLRAGMIQVLKDEELEKLESLKEKGQMYVVPPMCLDDLYWMLASVSNQTASTNGESIDVPKNTTEGGRFPGLRPMVISNDKMRDHKMDLLEERAFRRWCCSHIVNYNFTDFIENKEEEREITFHNADVFSDEIQGNECPGGGGVAWHFPVSEWDGNERFCLRLPS